MIRFATNNDIGGIIALWQEAFGDSPEEIKFFLDNKFKPENTLVIEECGAIASMLFLLDGKICISGNDYEAYYLYAACTAQKYRGRGMMSDLLKFAEKTAFERNVHFICLLPAEKSLFDYYSRFGYLPVFSKKILNMKCGEITDKTEAEFAFSGTSDFESLRSIAFEGVDKFKWSNDAILFAVSHTELYGGYCFVTDKGYALYSINDSKIYVKEFAFTQDKIVDFAGFLSKKHQVNEIIFILPYQFECNFGSVEIQKSGMMLPINSEAKVLIKNVENAYLGLTLD